ncbi:expressed protein [Phakopsora pachyrhizi]|uniref:Expressed protein n=1 Tax=Phakopsora pachyrhizi TaxID=170000 RepID=A0AAV0BF17_PHAPC|nr:expressed protein [Phakopsora pachyrhizi]
MPWLFYTCCIRRTSKLVQLTPFSQLVLLNCSSRDSSVPEQVQLKGSFDNWKNPLELKKEKSGKFGAQVELEFGSRILYKYVVDGDWRHNPNEPTESDADGNINNVLQGFYFLLSDPFRTLSSPITIYTP